MARKKSVRRKSFPKLPVHEAIRVVPLHHPEPRLVAKTDRGAAAAKLTYRGGPLIQAVQVFTIFWGKTWASVAASKTLVGEINAFFTDILVSPLIDRLTEYNVSGQSVGHGSLIGSKIITTGAPAASVTDSAIQSALKKWISAGTVPANKTDTLYFIYLEPA